MFSVCVFLSHQQTDQARRQQEIEHEKQRRAVDKAAAEQMRQAQAASLAKREVTGIAAAESSPTAIKEIPCLCKRQTAITVVVVCCSLFLLLLLLLLLFVVVVVVCCCCCCCCCCC